MDKADELVKLEELELIYLPRSMILMRVLLAASVLNVFFVIFDAQY